MRQHASETVLAATCKVLRTLPCGRITLFRLMHGCVGKPERFALHTDGFWFQVDTRDYDVAMRVALNRAYEPVVGALVLANLRPGAVAMDLGANKGYYTLLMAQAVGKNGTVYAYEADPRNVEDLQANKKFNPSLNLVVIDNAVASSEGEATFDLSGWGEENSAWGKIVDASLTADTSKCVHVKTCSLDDEVERLGIDTVDFLKMDIQGGEHQAVLGMKKTLENGVYGTVLLELHDMQLSREQCHETVDTFLANGYDGSAFDQNEISDADARHALATRKPLDVSSYGIPARDYDYGKRHAKGGYIKPLQFWLTKSASGK